MPLADGSDIFEWAQAEASLFCPSAEFRASTTSIFARPGCGKGCGSVMVVGMVIEGGFQILRVLDEPSYGSGELYRRV